VKKILFIITIGIAVVMVMPVIAQEEEDSGSKSPYYYVNVPIERIYPHRKGYVVSYRKGFTGLATTYLPVEWFAAGVGNSGKGDIVLLGPGSAWPYLTVFYKDGAFSHVRLYVRQERGHESWGNIPLTVNLDERFENVEDLKLEF
jgi:hypothetical protein